MTTESERGQILETVDRLIRDHVAPSAADIDRTDQFPHALYQKAAEVGVCALWIPEAYGGAACDLYTQLLVVERIARVSPAFSLTIATCGDGSSPIITGASEAIKKEVLPKIASGAYLPCYALSESGAGSDAASIKTAARREGDAYVITGSKMWCTNGSVGHVYSVFVKTDPAKGAKGISGFVVRRGAKGFTIGADEPLVGLRGSPTTQLHFDGVRVPATDMLGTEGEGFRIAMATLDEARLNAAASSLGLGAAALDHAIEYGRQRVQFERPIIDHQGHLFFLADLAIEYAAARALWRAGIDELMRGRSRKASALAAMAKVKCTEFGMRATVDAVQAMGGNGLSRNYPVERLMRDAKTFQIFDGTNQIQKIVIGRYLKTEGLPTLD